MQKHQLQKEVCLSWEKDFSKLCEYIQQGGLLKNKEKKEQEKKEQEKKSKEKKNESNDHFELPTAHLSLLLLFFSGSL